MIADVYGHPAPTPAMEDALRGALLHMSVKEGYLDTKHMPILTEGFRYERSVMELVSHVADEGGAQWHDRGPVARRLADKLEYKSSANLMAAVREAIVQGLIDASIRDGVGFLMPTSYGIEILNLWEDRDEFEEVQRMHDSKASD